jgi:diguanylate cyclase (GGDEF)-like protein
VQNYKVHDITTNRYIIVSIIAIYIVLIYVQHIQNNISLETTALALMVVFLFMKIMYAYKNKLMPLYLAQTAKNDAVVQENLAIAKFDKDFNITFASEKFINMIGIGDGNILDIYKNCSNNCDILKKLEKNLKSKISFNDMIELKQGKNSLFIDTFVQTIDNSKLSKNKYIMLCKDITPYIENELEVKNQLLVDKLTALPTRVKLIEDLKKMPAKKSNHAQTLLYIQIDSYEDINEFFGLDTGYAILKEITAWFQDNLPTKNTQLYKFEHDTFALHTTSRINLADLEDYLKNLTTKITKESIMVDGTSHDVALTIGVARGKSSLLKCSYLALKEATKRNKPYNIYNKKDLQEEKFLHNIQKNKDIKEALNDDRIVPFFQPILNIKTNEVEKFESLMRIQNRDNTHQSPIEFLEIAKKSKLYPQLTKAMINASLKRLELLRQPTTLNIAIEDILNPKVSAFILRKLEKFPYSNLLTFEILETEGVENYKKVASFIKKLKTYGCTIAIDDFGSGYSNFEQILKLDIDYIKIDGSLIKNILTNRENEIVIKTIINFAQELGVKTIAEFVSSEAIFDKVKSLGIDYAQGYYIGKPAPITLTKNS